MKTTNKLTDEDIIKAREILENNKDYDLINILKEWIKTKVQIAKKEERERVVEMIDSHVSSLEANNAVHEIFGEGYTKARKDFINLIKK